MPKKVYAAGDRTNELLEKLLLFALGTATGNGFRDVRIDRRRRSFSHSIQRLFKSLFRIVNWVRLRIERVVFGFAAMGRASIDIR